MSADKIICDKYQIHLIFFKQKVCFFYSCCCICQFLHSYKIKKGKGKHVFFTTGIPKVSKAALNSNMKAES